MRCCEKKPPWPFRPKHITCDGGENCLDPNLRPLTGTGIIANSYLQGLQSKICHALDHATVILEFSPNGEAVYTDSPLLSYRARGSCSFFRKCNVVGISDPETECRQCDALHARLFYDLTREQITEDKIIERFTNCPELVALYEKAAPGYHFSLVKDETRPYLEYDCSLLGYRELVFPIFYEDDVIGLFFVGQIALKEQAVFIEKTIKTLLSRRPACFAGYLKNHPGCTAEQIVYKINQLSVGGIHNTESARKTDLIEQPAYKRIIHNACLELDTLEKMLNEEMEHQRLAFVRTPVAREVRAFHDVPLVPIHAASKQPPELQLLWDWVEQSLKRLTKDFYFRYFLVFGTATASDWQSKELKVVGNGGAWSDVFDETTLQSLRLDISELPPKYFVCSATQDDVYLLKNLRGCNTANLGSFTFTVVPEMLHPQSSMAVMIGYYQDGEIDHTPKSTDADVLHETLESFFVVVVSSLSAILARHAEDNAKNQLRYLGHEASQLMTGLDQIRILYLDNVAKVRNISDKKGEDLCRDVKGFLNQLKFIFEMAQRITREQYPDVNRNPFRVYREVLFKWRDTYRLQGQRKRLQMCFEVEQLETTDPYRPPLNADQYLIEQLVYNLVGNAEKYCHRGTKIWVDCSLPEAGSKSHVLRVTDYGRRMPEGRDVYLPFTRGTPAGVDAEGVEGLGLGLYIARLIVRAHGGEIKHTCTRVSPFNVPLMKFYVSRNFRGKNAPWMSGVDKELHRLKAEGLYDKIVAYSLSGQERYIPRDTTLVDEIRKPTFEVTVEATIPNDGDPRK